MDIYEDAARYAAHGEAVLNGCSDGTEALTRTGSRRSNQANDAELAKSLAPRKRRVVLLADSLASVPDNFHLAADAVVELGSVLPRHVIAGAKLCLNLTVTQEQAEFIATVPLSIIASAVRRGRLVSVAIELMKKAIVPTRRKPPTRHRGRGSPPRRPIRRRWRLEGFGPPQRDVSGARF